MILSKRSKQRVSTVRYPLGEDAFGPNDTHLSLDLGPRHTPSHPYEARLRTRQAFLLSNVGKIPAACQTRPWLTAESKHFEYFCFVLTVEKHTTHHHTRIFTWYEKRSAHMLKRREIATTHMVISRVLVLGVFSSSVYILCDFPIWAGPCFFDRGYWERRLVLVRGTITTRLGEQKGQIRIYQTYPGHNISF